MERQLEGLARAGFQLLPAGFPTHYVIERDGLVALVEKRPDGSFGGIGAPGVLAGGEIAVLLWRGERPLLVSKGAERAAEAGEVEALRRFDAELRRILGGNLVF